MCPPEQQDSSVCMHQPPKILFNPYPPLIISEMIRIFVGPRIARVTSGDGSRGLGY